MSGDGGGGGSGRRIAATTTAHNAKKGAGRIGGGSGGVGGGGGGGGGGSNADQGIVGVGDDDGAELQQIVIRTDRCDSEELDSGTVDRPDGEDEMDQYFVEKISTALKSGDSASLLDIQKEVEAHHSTILDHDDDRDSQDEFGSFEEKASGGSHDASQEGSQGEWRLNNDDADAADRSDGRSDVDSIASSFVAASFAPSTVLSDDSAWRSGVRGPEWGLKSSELRTPSQEYTNPTSTSTYTSREL